ncbi:MAG TPA: hypothetical protein VFG76_06860 [Candidatus Polarisedimenticolia bacterium]|nr:hypothetical protein [Candidatus Polarisedimenticolia bacterium]
MALRDFIGERRTVVWAGRRFTVRKPTCKTVTLALSYFGREIIGCRGAYLKQPEIFTDPFSACFPFFTETPGIALVLASCVELHGAAPGELEELLGADRALCAELIRAVMGISDLGRIITLMDLDEAALEALEPGEQRETTAEADEDSSGPSPMELLAVGMAERFHCTPFDVMGWPYEAVISMAIEVLPALHPGQKGEDVFGLSADEWAKQGVVLQ